jgi:hypothetical protein
MAGRVRFPRIGAFEVWFGGKYVFSKLAHGQWPNPKHIAEKIRVIVAEE